MNVKKLLKEREELEYIVDNCKFETAKEVCELFEAYTHLIWKHKQIGRIYDFYYEDMIIHRHGGIDVIGTEQVVAETLASLARFSDCEFEFYGIEGVGNTEEGFRFGQALYYKGTFDGVSDKGLGNGATFEPHTGIGLCECLVKKVDGKWRVVEEWAARNTLTFLEIVKDALPFEGEEITKSSTLNKTVMEDEFQEEFDSIKSLVVE